MSATSFLSQTCFEELIKETSEDVGLYICERLSLPILDVAFIMPSKGVVHDVIKIL
jgi:hypothetical protein